MTHRHEVPATRTSNHEEHSLRILDAVEANHEVSQRSLSNDLGIALGLTNLLIRRLVRKGWLQVSNIRPNRVRYLITPTGIAEKARLSREYFDSSLHFYRKTRQRIQTQFASLSSHWPGDAGETKPIVFLGVGEVAEIGFVCLAETDLRLVGVVDWNRKSQTFFGFPVQSPMDIDGLSLGGVPFGRLVVMSFEDPDALTARTEALNLPSGAVFWL